MNGGEIILSGDKNTISNKGTGQKPDAAEFTDKEKLENAKIATPKEVTKLIKPGVIWSTNENMPMWLMISFIGLVAGAWITIIYIIVQIVKIRKLSRA